MSKAFHDLLSAYAVADAAALAASALLAQHRTCVGRYQHLTPCLKRPSSILLDEKRRLYFRRLDL